MEINNLLATCNIKSPYHIYTTNDFIISQAPYINNCKDLEALMGSKTNDNIVDDLQNQNFAFLNEHFKNKKNKIDDNILDNMILGILVMISIVMFIFVLPNGC